MHPVARTTFAVWPRDLLSLAVQFLDEIAAIDVHPPACTLDRHDPGNGTAQLRLDEHGEAAVQKRVEQY